MRAPEWIGVPAHLIRRQILSAPSNFLGHLPWAMAHALLLSSLIFSLYNLSHVRAPSWLALDLALWQLIATISALAFLFTCSCKGHNCTVATITHHHHTPPSHNVISNMRVHLTVPDREWVTA